MEISNVFSLFLLVLSDSSVGVPEPVASSYHRTVLGQFFLHSHLDLLCKKPTHCLLLLQLLQVLVTREPAVRRAWQMLVWLEAGPAMGVHYRYTQDTILSVQQHAEKHQEGCFS